MKEIAAQFTGKQFVPFTLDDEASASEFKKNQVVRLKITGAQKPRSYVQLQTFWAACNQVAENTKDNNWNTREKVAFQIKIATQFIDLNRTVVDPQGNIHPFYRSISFKELPHMAACNFFDQAFDVMAKHIGVTVNQLLENAER